MSKIFLIGLPKTATKTVAIELHNMGFNCYHYPTKEEQYEKFEVLGDLPVAMKFQELAEKYPDAKFIFTVRDPVTWHQSCSKHFSRKHTIKGSMYAQNRVKFLGSKYYEEEKFEKSRARHEKEVFEFFRGKDNFLVLDIFSGSPRSVLYEFLDREFDGDASEPFPNYDPTENAHKLKGGKREG